MTIENVLAFFTCKIRYEFFSRPPYRGLIPDRTKKVHITVLIPFPYVPSVSRLLDEEKYHYVLHTVIVSSLPAVMPVLSSFYPAYVFSRHLTAIRFLHMPYKHTHLLQMYRFVVARNIFDVCCPKGQVCQGTKA